ncbi:MAG: cell division protein FtsQ [Pseudomonadota bacterium]|nr:cell division protein FtsQ [Pseudomonadota bacterium]
MDTDIQTKTSKNWLIILFVFAIILTARLAIMIISDSQYFPINVLKIEAPYHYLTRDKIQELIAPYMNQSFLMFSEEKLQEDFKKNAWVEKITVNKIWPDRVIVQIIERFPVAFWNNMLLSDKGDLFIPEKIDFLSEIPRFQGPEDQQKEVLHIFKKLSKLLLANDLVINELRLRDNHSWELTLSNGVTIRLGKHDVEGRLRRFCQVYPKWFATSFERISFIDLRYPHGLAVSWKKNSAQIISNPKKDMG